MGDVCECLCEYVFYVVCCVICGVLVYVLFSVMYVLCGVMYVLCVVCCVGGSLESSSDDCHCPPHTWQHISMETQQLSILIETRQGRTVGNPPSHNKRFEMK